MQKKKWILYGATGVFGLSLLAGGAVTAANAMDLRTTSGDTVAGGVITGEEAVAAAPAAKVDVDSSVSVVSVPSANSIDSSPSTDSPNSAPSADSPDSAPSAPSAPSAQSAPSAASVASADSL